MADLWRFAEEHHYLRALRPTDDDGRAGKPDPDCDRREQENVSAAAFGDALEEETNLVGTNPELLMVMGDPSRDPRKHIVSIVYSVTAPDGEPVAGDDAADARFWPLQEVLNGEVPLAGDHLQIIKNWFNLSDS